MSLDVYLDDPTEVIAGGTGIFVRENGSTREITRAEWDEKFPGREPILVNASGDEPNRRVYSCNITHNLGRMADAAGLYETLWRPDEIAITKASQLIEPLRKGLAELFNRPDHYTQFNPENGWGDYDGLVDFVSEYLKACEQYPNADVSVSR